MKYLFIFSYLFSMLLNAQPNCEVYKNDPECYKACQKAMTAIKYQQGSYTSQKYFDQSIELCDNLGYSYMEKAVPFLKRGQFIEWKKLIDKAVEINPKEFLGYRGWCRLQFLRDYNGAIKDIEQLKRISKYDIGYCQTGDYHLNVALALCYKEIGQIEKAKKIFNTHLNLGITSVDLYDYYHLGIIEYELGNYEQAIVCFKKQIQENDYMGETYFFIAKAYLKLNMTEYYYPNLIKAKEYYEKGYYRTDTYTETIDKVYLLDILIEMKN